MTYPGLISKFACNTSYLIFCKSAFGPDFMNFNHLRAAAMSGTVIIAGCDANLSETCTKYKTQNIKEFEI